jgi:hypothetical protein
VSRDFQLFPVPVLNEVAQNAGINPRVAVYIANDSGKVIVCQTVSPTKGLYVEQDPAAMLSPDAPNDFLGQSVWQALLSFRADSSAGTGREMRTEWPAFKASGVKGIREFEATHVRISVEAFPTVLRVEAVVPAKAAEGIFVGRYISSSCEFETLGDLIRLACRCSLYLAEQEFA